MKRKLACKDSEHQSEDKSLIISSEVNSFQTLEGTSSCAGS